MKNSPKYSFFKNWKYALAGFFEVLKTEKSFKIELIIFLFLFISLIFFKFDFLDNLFLISSIFIVIVTELLNSAIERAVDLVTLEKHDLAKKAKDAAAAAVMFSNFLCFLTWITILYKNFL